MMARDEPAALDAGCAGYICKPIDTRAFADLVRPLLTRQRAPAGGEPRT